METAYRQIEWHWTEWHGRYDSVEQSKIVDIPYQRYPRTFIPPPSIELVVTTTIRGATVIVGPSVEFHSDNEQSLLHIINLFKSELFH